MHKRLLYLGLDPASYDKANCQLTHWPVIRIVPYPLLEPTLQHTFKQFSSYTHVLITSKTTVAILKEYLPKVGIPFEAWKMKQTLAVGKVTAKHLQNIGISPTITAKEETAEGLVNELQKLSLENAHLFWPHSSESRPILKDFLEGAHIRYTDCALYSPQTHIPGPLPDLNTFDEIVFTSPSTVKAFFSIFEKIPSHLQLIPIGPVTAKSLETFTSLPN